MTDFHSPSRSPQRSATDSRVPSSHSYSPSPLSGAIPNSGAGTAPAYSTYDPSPSTAYSSPHPNTPPSASSRTATQHRQTISEEASAHVGKMVGLSRSAREESEYREPSDRKTTSGSVSRNGTVASAANGNGSSSKEGQSRSRNRTVGDWQLQKTLGAGSMGKVKLATNIHTKEKVSLVLR